MTTERQENDDRHAVQSVLSPRLDAIDLLVLMVLAACGWAL